MSIITLSREFGSGGRELGKRMSGLLGWDYYDREIITEVASRSGMDPQYVNSVLTRGIPGGYSIAIGRTFSCSSVPQNTAALLSIQHMVVREIAAQSRDCVIVGRGADVILRPHRPFNLFVYADMDAKVRRCRARAPEGERLSDRELLRQIKRVDAGRARYRELISNSVWGKKDAYHLCINTTGLSIRILAPLIAEYANLWFRSANTDGDPTV